MASALYPGSFDPPTRGHLDLVRRAAATFGGVTVAVANNPDKRGLFAVDERLEMLRGELSGVAGVEVVAFDGLVVDLCRARGHTVLVRGLRSAADFEFELPMAMTNRHLAPAVETVFLVSDAAYAHVSSSLIKDIVRHGGDAGAFLTPDVQARLKTRLEETSR